MRQYIARRLLVFIPVAVVVSLMIFLLMRVIPGDVALIILTGEGGGGQVSQEALADMRHQLGLDQPLYQQYVSWVWGMLHLDAGNSLWTGRPVFDEIAKRLPLSIELAVLSGLVSLAIAIPVGTLSAIRQDTWVDYLFRFVTIGGIAMPTFWTGTIIILVASAVFGWTAPLGYASIIDNPSANLQQLIWPAVALGYYFSAVVSRMTRSCMLEVLRQDYVRTAWAKGLRERVVVARHALKNAMLPVVTIVGLQFGILLGGTVVMERVFTLPGMGNAMIDSIFHRDYPMTQALVVILAMLFMTVNLLVDLAYAWLDPRIRYG